MTKQEDLIREDIKELHETISELSRKIDALNSEVGGSKFGRMGIVEKQDFFDKELDSVKDDIKGLKRIRAEIALAAGMAGAMLKAGFDWLIRTDHGGND